MAFLQSSKSFEGGDMSRKLSVISFIALSVVFCGQIVLAQVTSGTISGTVSDQTGAVLPGVEIAVNNVDTGIQRSAISGDAGGYRVTNLSVGNYEVVASLPGFQTGVRIGISLSIGREAAVNFTLSIGEVTERVTVTGEAPLVSTTSGSLGDLVDRRTVQDLPLNGRDLTGLLTLQAGVTLSTSASTGASPGFSRKVSIGGARPQDNAVLIDGTEVKGIDGGVPAGISGNFVGVEAIQEFKIERNSYSAQFGSNAGGVINVVSKSGSNEFHGSAYWFHRNDALDAANFITNRSGLDKPEFKRNQFGFSIGGPIVSNRTFFFFNYEGMRERLGNTIIQTTLNSSTRLGDLDGDGVAEVAVNPTVVPYLDLWPLPGAGSVDQGDGTSRQGRNASQPTDENFYQARVDHNFTDNNSMFGRLTRQTSFQTTPGAFEQWFGEYFSPNLFFSLEDKHIFSPNFLGTFRASFNRRGQGQFSFEDPVSTTPRFIPEAVWRAPLGAAFVQGALAVTGVSNVGLARGWVDRKVNRFQYAGDLVWNRGRHSVKFGLDWQRIQYNGDNPSRPSGQFSFKSVKNLLQGNSNRFRGDILPITDSVRGIRWNVVGWYIQDDWQVHPQLTLNLGWRHEFFTVPTEVNDKISNLRNPYTDTEPSLGGPWHENPSLLSFAPRIGLAWDPTGSGKMAIRAGAGIFYNHIAAGTYRQAAHRTQPFAVESNLRRPIPPATSLFPDVYDQLLTLDDPASSGDIHIFPYHKDGIANPSAYQWNLNVQTEIMPDMALTLGYAGSRGIHLVQQVYLQTPRADVIDGRVVFPTDAPDNIPNPAFSNLDLRSRETSADSWYNSLQMSLQRRFADGFQMQLSYTWSKSQDTASQINNDFQGTGGATLQHYHLPFLKKSRSPWDAHHNFSASWVLELPFGSGRRFGPDWGGALDAVLGGWQLGSILALTDGSPITITQSKRDFMDDVRIGWDSPDLGSGSTNPVIGDSTRYFDKSGFVDLNDFEDDFDTDPDSAGGILYRTIGNLGRNTMTGPGIINLDFSLNKNTALSEEVNLSFRVECFNVLNRTNLGIPAGNISTGSAGRISSTSTTNRQIQLGLRFSF
jgi:hypothetical protein